MTSTPGTPNFTVPPTQNTASVIRFRCLYTHDLRRKAKRWHDGYLRYHTFNKRVMVYDEPGNFVGDLHWRSEEMIADGDEVELDKGVLIQVGECLESGVADLSPLFERRAQSSQQKQGKNTPVRGSQLSQLQSGSQSRSLNDLLGIKRTPIERLKSPYEQRDLPPSRPTGNTGTARDTEVSRPVKRQRMDGEVSAKRTAAKDLSESVAAKPTTTRDEPPSRVPALAPAPAQTRTLPRQRRMPGGPAAATSASTLPNVSTRKADSRPQNFSETTQPSAPQSSTSSNPTSASQNTLKLSKGQPRKKLMYRALLPGQTKETSSSSDRVSPQITEKQQEAPNPASLDWDRVNDYLDPGDTTLDVLADLRDESMSDAGSDGGSRGKSMANAQQRPVPPVPDTTLNTFAEVIEISSDDGSNNESPAKGEMNTRQNPIPDDTALNAFVTAENSSSKIESFSETRAKEGETNTRQNPIPDNTTLDVFAETMEASSDAGSNDEPYRVDDTNTQEQTSSNPLPAPTESAHVPNEKPRPNLPHPSFAAVNRAARSQGIPPVVASAPAKPTTRNLQKSYSDPSAFHTVNTIQSRQLPSSTLNPHAERNRVRNEQPPDPFPDRGQDQVQDQGPWTMEALYLFDFWPPDRARPCL